MKSETLNPFIISIITCCRLYKINYLDNKEFSSKTKIIYRNKIKNIFKTALFWGFDSVIFDSLGCNINNIYEMPIKQCASILKEVIFDKKDNYFKKFKNITFCIDVRNIDNSLKPKNLNDPNKYIYENEQKNRNYEMNVFKIFHQVLNGVDEFS